MNARCQVAPEFKAIPAGTSRARNEQTQITASWGGGTEGQRQRESDDAAGVHPRRRWPTCCGLRPSSSPSNSSSSSLCFSFFSAARDTSHGTRFGILAEGTRCLAPGGVRESPAYASRIAAGPPHIMHISAAS